MTICFCGKRLYVMNFLAWLVTWVIHNDDWSSGSPRRIKPSVMFKNFIYSSIWDCCSIFLSQIFLNESLRELSFRPLWQPKSECWGQGIGEFVKQLINATAKISLESTHFSLPRWSKPPSSIILLTTAASSLVFLVPPLLPPIHYSFSSQRDVFKI